MNKVLQGFNDEEIPLTFFFVFVSASCSPKIIILWAFIIYYMQESWVWILLYPPYPIAVKP